MTPFKHNRSFKGKKLNLNKRLEQEEKDKAEIHSFNGGQSLLNYPLITLKNDAKNAFGDSFDFHVEDELVAGRKALLFYIESLVDSKTMKEMTAKLFSTQITEQSGSLTIDQLVVLFKEVFGGVSCQLIGMVDGIYSALLNGHIVIFLDGLAKAIAINMENTEKRSVTEPSTQTVIRGPKDGFVESLSTNVTLIRRRIRSPNLRFEQFILGKDTQTPVYLGFVKGIANEAILKEVRSRLNKINVSSVFESGNIEEMIADKTFTPFPLALNTERPDTVAANLMEGKIVILVDGTPFALLVPAVLVNFFEISEDYYQPFLLGSFIRGIRYLSFMIALLTPSIYVGILTFNHELLPTSLLLSVIAQREGVPFPAVVEVLLMEITFEILREAGVRVPRTVGQMVAIVGALVIGQAAAEAGIISNIMIIIVSITGIANFVAPVYSFAAASRLIRFLLIISASVLGLYGILIVLVAMVAHLSSLRSFGVPYLAPIAPFIIEDQKDVFVRFPWWAMQNRPKYLRTESEKKVYSNTSPSPPPMKGGNDG